MKKILIFIIINMFIFAEAYELRIETGVLNGVAHEIVYWDETREMSKLIWPLDNVKIIELGIKKNISKKYKINISFTNKIDSDLVYMEDYDWMNTNDLDNWTHWSISPTELKELKKINSNIEKEYKKHKYTFSILSGLKYDRYKWIATGGKRIYYGVEATLPNIPVISYTQNFYTPYLGLSYGYGENHLVLSSKLLYSPFVYAHDKDIHHIQNENATNPTVIFEDYFFNGQYLEGQILINYLIKNQLKLTLAYEYSHYLKNRGDLVKTVVQTGDSFEISDCVGIENKTSTISLGLTYKF